ncbi:MAG TPA: uroporphyrinogen-III C-methyltransferase [Gallionellaceae bacterium]|nr:uroporphyrinogen-III C-methyltransferase [Gallionellaceae bacterium]
MTEQNNVADEPQNTASTPVHKNPLARAISHLNLTQLTLAVLVVVFLWQWIDGKQQLNQIQQTLAHRLAEVDGSNKATQTLTLQSQELVRELGGKLSVLESKYAETQSQRAALETLYQDMSSSRDQMVLAEVEQLLLIAGQQLQLASNVKAALIAMQQADSRLQRLDRAALGSLRRAINSDMDKLRSLPDVDVSAINARLDSLISLVDRLPLVQDIRTPQESLTPTAVSTDSGWQKLLREMWQDIKNLVRIENTHQSELPLLSPTQTFFLRENLKLRLLSARMALLTRDEASFKHDIKTAQEWIKLYFDFKNGDGAQAVNTLQKLNASRIKIELPDVSSSLEAVRHYRASREKDVR